MKNAAGTAVVGNSHAKITYRAQRTTPADPETPLGQLMELQAEHRAKVDSAAIEGKAAQDMFFGNEVARLSAEAARLEFEAVSGRRTRVGHMLGKLARRLRG